VAPRDELLADLVLDTMVWFELVDDDTLHPDTAVNMLEGYTAGFQRLGASDRLWLYERVRARAAQERDLKAKRLLEAVAGDLLDA
jgi:hypothetical protein